MCQAHTCDVVQHDTILIKSLVVWRAAACRESKDSTKHGVRSKTSARRARCFITAPAAPEVTLREVEFKIFEFELD